METRYLVTYLIGGLFAGVGLLCTFTIFLAWIGIPLMILACIIFAVAFSQGSKAHKEQKDINKRLIENQNNQGNGSQVYAV